MTPKKDYNPTMMKGKIKRIFIDMDGVLADFLRGVEMPQYLGEPLTNDAEGHTTYDLRKEELDEKFLSVCGSIRILNFPEPDKTKQERSIAILNFA